METESKREKRRSGGSDGKGRNKRVEQKAHQRREVMGERQRYKSGEEEKREEERTGGKAEVAKLRVCTDSETKSRVCSCSPDPGEKNTVSSQQGVKA